jgi:hypothetical protein
MYDMGDLVYKFHERAHKAPTRIEMSKETLYQLSTDPYFCYIIGVSIEESIARILRLDDIVVDHSMNGEYIIIAHERIYS